MPQKKLYIFVEGIDDFLFINDVFKSIALKKYDDIEIIQYAQMKRVKVNKYIETIKKMGFDYFVLADIDQEASIKNKRIIIKNRFSEVDYLNIIVVIAEIESWYLAGISKEQSIKWGIHNFERTDIIVKEEFNKVYWCKFHNRIDFMQEIRNHYDISVGVTKNESLKYFYSLFDVQVK
jgi:hypothetical protein